MRTRLVFTASRAAVAQGSGKTSCPSMTHTCSHPAASASWTISMYWGCGMSCIRNRSHLTMPLHIAWCAHASTRSEGLGSVGRPGTGTGHADDLETGPRAKPERVANAHLSRNHCIEDLSRVMADSAKGRSWAWSTWFREDSPASNSEFVDRIPSTSVYCLPLHISHLAQTCPMRRDDASGSAGSLARRPLSSGLAAHPRVGGSDQPCRFLHRDRKRGGADVPAGPDRRPSREAPRGRLPAPVPDSPPRWTGHIPLCAAGREDIRTRLRDPWGRVRSLRSRELRNRATRMGTARRGRRPGRSDICRRDLRKGPWCPARLRRRRCLV